MNLLAEWAAWQPTTAPHVLEGDRLVLSSQRSTESSLTTTSWTEAYRRGDFCAPNDRRLHLGLLPQPFCGDLRSASVYVLLLNPGLGPSDYFAEYEGPGFRDAWLANLRQDFTDVRFPFVFLDPQFA